MHHSARLFPWQRQEVRNLLELFSFWALYKDIRLGFWWTLEVPILLSVNLWPLSCLEHLLSVLLFMLQ